MKNPWADSTRAYREAEDALQLLRAELERPEPRHYRANSLAEAERLPKPDQSAVVRSECLTGAAAAISRATL